MKLPSQTLATFSLSLAAALALSTSGAAQRRAPQRSSGPGVVSRISWQEDGKSVSFTTADKRYELNLNTLARKDITDDAAQQPSGAARRRGRANERGASMGKYVGRPSRGRQYTRVDSPNGEWQAHYKDWNVVIKNRDGDEVAVTTKGNADVHYGTASWVYGEELNQTKSMWWTPDSKKLIYYGFDDRGVQAFHLLRGWSKINTTQYPEFYPKAGAKNPAAELLIYDLESKSSVRVDIGGSSEEYIYGLRASPDGSVIMVNWTDRLQQHLKVLAIDVNTGKTRLIVEEKQDTWQTNSPTMRFLKDKKRFLWPSDKSGFTHYEVRDLDGKLHNTVTAGDFQTAGIQFVDEENGLVGFTAYSSKSNPYFLQYHIARLDGKSQRRVTSIDQHHSSFSVSPDRKWVVARHEEVDTPPSTTLYRASDSKAVIVLAQGDKQGKGLAEMFKFKSNDGKFDIYGVLYKPKDFDPKKTYPIINALYGGPGSNEISARYVSSLRAECRKGYFVIKVNNRGTGNRGKKFLGSNYLRLGDVDIQDHADGVRLVTKRPYIDGKRVGIVGHSYGGFMAAMGIFKFPDVYAAASIGAGVTDWRNYDTIYTERYMSTPQLNEKGYNVGSVMTYAKNLKGKALILHGMVDDNVHPNNAFQLIDALDKARISYESRFWPNGGHGLGAGASQTRWEFLDRVLKP